MPTDLELIESWRNDDLKLWQEAIIPAFEAANPGITVNSSPMPRARQSSGNSRQ